MTVKQRFNSFFQLLELSELFYLIFNILDSFKINCQIKSIDDNLVKTSK
jgi:hypothetical protein